MRKIILLAAFFLLTGKGFAHPGKTDYHGGHKCWKGCNEWKLGYGEYHLHDEDWMPIKVSKEYRQVKPSKPEQVSGQEIAIQEKTEDTARDIPTVEKPAGKIPDEQNQEISVYEENILPFNMILLVIVLLLLICLMFLRKKREKD